MPGLYGDERVTLRKGILYRRPRGSSGPYFPFGAMASGEYAFEVDEIEVPFTQAARGGTWAALKRPKKMTLTAALYDFTPENEALGLAGTMTHEAAGTATDEPVTLYAGANVPLAHIPTAISEVKLAAGATAPTRANSTAYAVGDFYVPATPNGHYYKVIAAGTSGSTPPTFATDGTTFADGTATVQDMGLIVLAAGSYVRSRGGIFVPPAATFGGITATQGVAALVTYTYPDVTRIDAMTAVGQEWELYYEADDEMQAGDVMRAWFYRATFGPATRMPLYTEEPGQIELTATVLADPSITDPDVSQFHHVEKKAA